MRSLLALTSLLLMAVVVKQVKAGEYDGGSNRAALASDSRALSQSGSQVNVDNRRSSSSYSQATDLSRTVPGVIAPSPSVGFYVCDSAYTVGVGFAGAGFGFGVPVSDTQCNRRADATAMLQVGDQKTAKEILCESVRAFRASYRAGRPCFPNPELLDELTDEERKVLSNVRSVNNAMGKRNVYKEMNLLEERVGKKLDNFHRINQMK